MTDADRIAAMAARLDPASAAALSVMLAAMVGDPAADEERLAAQRRAVLNRETFPQISQLDEFARLRSQGLTVREAGAAMFVHRRTAERWERMRQVPA